MRRPRPRAAAADPCYARAMKLAALLAGFLVTACGGGRAKVTPAPAPAPPDLGVPEVPAPPVDPHLEARRAYANPGGMWMPSQMTLPGHAATFAQLGVALDPARLADPLAAPLGAIVRLGGCSASSLGGRPGWPV